MNYILVILSTILMSLDFTLQKKYQVLEGDNLRAGLKYNALNGLFTAFIFWGFCGFKVEFTWFSVIMALALALFGMTYSVIGLKVLKSGGMSIYSIFLMCGGMVVPYIYGVLLLNEPLTLLRICGVLMIIVAVILSNKTKVSVKFMLFLLCVAVFFLNGAVNIISKSHQINATFAAVSSNAFIMYSGIGKFVFGVCGQPFCKDETKKTFFSSKATVYVVLCSAFISGVAYLMQLTGAKDLPASVLYPIVSGGSIIFSALSGKVFFKEKLSICQLISIVLCFIGTLLFL